MTGVSFVIPVCNGGPRLADTLASIAAQADGRLMEVIVVEDGSGDGSGELLESLARAYPLTLVRGPGRGAAAAVNAGVRVARHPFVCQVDQDVVLQDGWLATLLEAFTDPQVAAAQGRYIHDHRASLLARVMALDLEERYSHLGTHTDHVCTGNTVYRAAALRDVGLLDESFGYGCDNDLSYRLQAAGYRLAFCREARSHHRWRETLRGYLTQQYGFGYGRLDVVSRHPARCAGDAVSPARMMAHPVIMGAALLLMAGGMVVPGLALVAVLAAERAVAGVRAWRTFRDPAALAFPLVHLARDGAWLVAAAVWATRRILRRPARPAHSMARRPART
jgi:hypothetical protein